jgi:flagellar biosynthesis protein FliR
VKLDFSLLTVCAVVGTRLTGVMLVAPALSSNLVPAKIKVFLLLALTFLLGSALRESIPAPASLGALLPILVIEFLAGLLIGLAFRWTLAAVEIAGEMAGLQMGMGVASTLDPSTGNNALFTQAIFALLYATCFFAMEGHHAVLRTLCASYTVVPVGGPVDAAGLTPALIRQTAELMAVGLRLAAGFLIPLLLVTFAMAMVSRAFPQANVFILSYAASLMLGLMLFATATPSLRAAVRQGMEGGARNAFEMLQGLTAH